ncbi:tetratricopeptide repeat protein [Gammaproteobacteria bacterium]|nr:tetratricopeptide repeat protein [Gammaproteobacteria bacterium]
MKPKKVLTKEKTSRLAMELGNFFLSVLILIAVGLAWYSGYRTRIKSHYSLTKNDHKDYFIGLNYLLNDEPDQSIDAFISSLEINSTTLESHLALGDLLRRRGKVDGSIAVYQKLLAISQLDNKELNQVKLGLVKSYVAAGLFDRAEKLIDELKVADTKIQIAALKIGLTVYQLEKEWQKAIKAANHLLKLSMPNERQEIQAKASHFYCELAEKELDLQHYNQAKEYLSKARNMDKANVRTSLILGKLEFEQANYKQAIKALLKISTQNPSFTAEAFDLIIASYQALNNHKKIQKFIEHSLEDPLSAGLLLKVIQYIKGSEGRGKAKEVLFQRIESKPSIELLGQAILLNDNAEIDPNAEKFHEILTNYLESKTKYQCGSCGFELKSLHWQCPGCNEWGFIKPIDPFIKEVDG